jgi:hypothetical protein
MLEMTIQEKKYRNPIEEEDDHKELRFRKFRIIN